MSSKIKSHCNTYSVSFDTPKDAIQLIHDSLPSSFDAVAGRHSFRVDQLTVPSSLIGTVYAEVGALWHVKAYGKYIAVFETERDALHWLAMFILKTSVLPQHEKEL